MQIVRNENNMILCPFGNKKRPRIRIDGVLADGLTVRQSAVAQWFSRQTSQPVVQNTYPSGSGDSSKTRLTY